MESAPPIRNRLAPPGRDLGVDAARGLALFGMMATHIMPLATAAGAVAFAGHFAGRASALFAVLAGFSIVLSTRSRLSAGHPGRAACTLLIRGVLIFAIGLLLGQLTTHLAIILTVYGAMFVVAPLLLRAPTWSLGALAPVWLTGSPIVSFLLRRAWQVKPDMHVPDVVSLADPGRLVEAVVLTGYYPALQWFGFIVLGMFLARLPSPGRRGHGTVLWAVIAAAGAVVALLAKVISSALLNAGGRAAISAELADDHRSLDQTLVEGNDGLTPFDTWWWLSIAAPHSGTPFDMVHTAGFAVAVLALCRLFVGWLSGAGDGTGTSASGYARLAVLTPLTSPGSMPLTVYAFHTVVLEITAATSLPDTAEWLIHVVLFAVGPTLWKALVASRGLLEALVNATTQLVPR